MSTLGKRAIEAGIVSGLCLGAVVGFAGCEQGSFGTGDVETESSAVASENGLNMNGLNMNGLNMNGLNMNGLNMNGLNMNGLNMNGLAMANGLSTTSGLMTTPGGREIVKYMVKCAFPAGHALITRDQYGTSYTFPGSLNEAPELESSLCGPDCQERVSACMLAHVNNAGVHIQLWLDGDGAMGWGQDAGYPYQEGAFFGNLFQTGWKGYYCMGKDFDVGSVPGRLGAPLASNVYVDPYGTNVECGQSGRCVAHGADGYDSCQTPDQYTWRHVVTAWRNFDVNTQYKICNYASASAKCLGVVAGNTADGAQVELRTYAGTAGQKWSIAQVSPGKYKIINVTSGKALDQDAARHVIQKTYSGVPTQLVAIKSLSASSQFGRYNLIPSSGTIGLDALVPNDGALVQVDANLTLDVAKWTVVPVQ